MTSFGAHAEVLVLGHSQFEYDVARISPSVLAELPSNADQFAYLYVKETCQMTKQGAIDQLKVLKESTTSSALMVLNVNVDNLRSLLRRGGLSPLTSLVLKSRGLGIALKECQPQSEFLRRSYVIGLIANDISGLIGGVGVNLIGGAIVAKGGAWVISKAAWEPLSYFLQSSGISEEVISFIKMSLVTVATETSVYLTSKSMRDSHAQMRQAAKAMQEQNPDEILKEMDQNMQSGLRALRGSKGSPYEPFWRNNLKSSLQNFDEQLQIYQKDSSVDETSKKYWQDKYETYLKEVNN